MCVIRVRGSINYINILLKLQGRVYKDPKRGRKHVLIFLPQWKFIWWWLSNEGQCYARFPDTNSRNSKEQVGALKKM